MIEALACRMSVFASQSKGVKASPMESREITSRLP
jgi:hypothetical protein